MLEPGYDPIDEANERLRNALTQLKQARLVQKVFMGLGKALTLGASQEDILGTIVEAVRSLFPEAYYLVQLADPKSLLPTLVEHHGPLAEGAAQHIHLSRSAVAKTQLDDAHPEFRNIVCWERLERLFEGTSHAIHVPLAADNQLFGAVQVEGTEAAPLGDDDEVLLISLANQLALSLRNQRLLEETAFLKDYLASILEQANALIVVTDINRQILVFNQALERLLGFPKEEVLGTDVFLWIPAEDQARFAEAISATLSGQADGGAVESRMRGRGGEPIQIQWSLSALRDQQGEVDSLILVGRDMTQVRALERQIIEAEKMASLGKLAAGVVHELNNPLTSISVYSEYILKKMRSGQVGPGDDDKLEKVLEGAHRIQKLTRDLVSYGRPSSEEPEPLQLNDLVAQGLSFCEHIIRKHDVEVSQDLCRELPLIQGNRNQLLQVLINLVTNACQAMEGGGQLGLTTRPGPGETVEFLVADTGVGIPAKDLQRIFEPFFTTKSAGVGTGLGLSIVSRIVEHHRGTICVDSEPGAGATFSVRLPARPSPPEAPPPAGETDGQETL
ncbi:MAG TPA: ATP-binding protein [Myxococcota bacterium]|nr:ATP-binding protein [Myxococcota bacterium]HRY95628.1 ATP-binding protein [Myxococcota bacterium]HSA20347.1 ATP-binding protein [Myxococcota bacterium]